jgi:Retrotransposon gag protein
MSSPITSPSEEREARERDELQEMKDRIAELEEEKQEQAERLLELSKRKATELKTSTDVEGEGTIQEPPLRRLRSGDPVKPPKPPTFEGIGRMNVDLWIFEVEQYFQVVRVPKDEQVGWAGTLLRDAAATWWRSVVIEAQGANHETKPDLDYPEPKPASQLFTWGKFKELIRTRFVPIEASKTARMRLLNLKQLKFGGIEGYNNEFQKLLSLIVDMNVADQINYYVMGLKPEVARDVNLASPKTLLEAMGLASRSSDSLAQNFAAANRYSSSRFRSASSSSYPSSTSTSGVSSTEPSSHSSSSAVSTIQSTSRADPEYSNTSLTDVDRGEVNFINRNDGFRPTSYLLNRDEWDRLKREKKCFRCKRTGHLAHECRRFPSQTRGPYRGYNSRPSQPSLNSQARRF